MKTSKVYYKLTLETVRLDTDTTVNIKTIKADSPEEAVDFAYSLINGDVYEPSIPKTGADIRNKGVK